MVRRFWIAFISAVIGLLAVDILSWFYIVSHLTLEIPSGGLAQRLVLPTQAPTIWNLVQPSNTKEWLGPLLVLIVQVWLTGSFYGALIRGNTNTEVNTATFIVDGFKSFGRLLLWNLLWAAAAVVVIGVNQALPAFGPALDVLILLLRFVFMFGDVALVAERNPRYALRAAPGVLLQHWLVMLPYGIVLLVLTDAGRALSAITSPTLFLLIALLYTVLTAWVLHMVVARYLAFSGWHERSEGTAPASN